MAVCQRGAGGRRLGVHLGDPAEIAALQGSKKRAKTDRADARLLRTLLLEGRFPASWIAPAHVLEVRTLGRSYCTLMDERRGWQQRIHAQLFHQGCPPITALLSHAASALGERIGPLPNVLSKRSRTLRPRIADAKKTPGVCPYCAVGCGTTVYSRDNTIVDVEGNPESPINAGTLCPKGSATFQLHVNPNRWTTCRYRAPFATEWTDVPYDWAMERIAERVKDARDRTFTEFDEEGRRVARTTAIASLGGATLDCEENYLITKLWRSMGGVFVENQARI